MGTRDRAIAAAAGLSVLISAHVLVSLPRGGVVSAWEQGHPALASSLFPRDPQAGEPEPAAARRDGLSLVLAPREEELRGGGAGGPLDSQEPAGSTSGPERAPGLVGLESFRWQSPPRPAPAGGPELSSATLSLLYNRADAPARPGRRDRSTLP